MSDANLVNRVKNGDGSAWYEVVNTHQEVMFRLAYLILGDADEAEETAQEAFIRAYQAIDRFDLSRPLKPWLLSIVANAAKNRKRSLGRYFNSLKRLINSEPRVSASTESQYTEQKQALELHIAIKQLDNIGQQIIYLRYFMDLSVKESAQVLKIAEGTVKSRLHRAIQRLGAIMEQKLTE